MRAALLRRRRAGGGFGYLAANGFTPDLVADFVRGRYRSASGPTTFAGLFTFARSSAARKTDANGNLVAVAANEPRQNHHVYEGGQWVNKGLLIESESRTNLVTYSEAFSNAAWTKVKCSISADQNDGPGGASTMDKIVEDSSLGEHAINFNQASTASQVYTGSVYCASAGRTIARLSFANLANSNVWFDLSSGTVLTQGAAVESATVENMGGGVYRLRATWTATSTVNYFAFGPASADNVATYTGDGSSGIYVWGAQLEAGSTPSSYIPTSAATVIRDNDEKSAASGNWAYDSSAMWGAFDFTETYADEGTAGLVELLDIRADANNRITITLDTDGAETGELTLTMVNGGTSASVAVDALSPGIWQEAKFAWRVTDSDIAISLNGASEVRTATVIGIPNLSAAAMQFEGMGTRALITQGAGDVGAAGIEGASA